MAYVRATFSLAVVLCLLSSGLAQQPQSGQPKPGKTSPPLSDEEAGLIAQQKKLAIPRVYGFTEQLLALRNTKIKTKALTRLADLFWKTDEPYARQLFTKALELCAPKSGTPAAEAQVMTRLRREVVAAIAKRDTSLAKRLIDNNGGLDEMDKAARADERMETDFKTAYELVKDAPDRSIEFAERSLRNGLPPDIYSLLILLRLSNETAANTLFLKILDQLTAQPVVPAETLLLLGTYVFTSPAFDPNDQSIAPDTVRLTGVGRMLVYDITADRPNVSHAIVHAYLTAAVNILTRQIPAPTQRAQYYVAARLLLAKTIKFAPELTQTIAGVMQRCLPDIPQELTLDSAYANFEVPTPQKLSETIKELEKEKNEQRRNERYLILIADLWRHADFATARRLNAKLSDSEAQSSIATLINFKEAAEKLNRVEDLDEVEGTANKLPPGVERALLWLGVARAYGKAGNVQRASESLNTALAAAQKVSDARRPFLMLSAASQLATLDPAMAQTTLAEAVRQFDTYDSEALGQVNWEQRVETGRMWRDFPLDVKGVECDFRQSLPPLVKTDLEGTVGAVRKLTDERQLASALLAIAAAILT